MEKITIGQGYGSCGNDKCGIHEGTNCPNCGFPLRYFPTAKQLKKIKA